MLAISENALMPYVIVEHNLSKKWFPFFRIMLWLAEMQTQHEELTR